jgi:hypothetical protein
MLLLACTENAAEAASFLPHSMADLSFAAINVRDKHGKDAFEEDFPIWTYRNCGAIFG